MKSIKVLILILMAASFLQGQNSFAGKNKSLNRKADTAKEIILKSVNAMGGAPALRRLNYISYKGMGHSFVTSITIKPEGAQPTQYDTIQQVMSLKDNALNKTVSSRVSFRASEFNYSLTASGASGAMEVGGKVNPPAAYQIYKSQDEFLMNPVKSILAALDANDLSVKSPINIEGVPHQVITFKQGNIPTTIFINSYTQLPDAIEIIRNYPADAFSDMWGDITTRTIYTNWSYEQGGIRYPRQWTTDVNGELTNQFSITTLNLNETPKPDLFNIAENVKIASEKSLNTQGQEFAQQNIAGASLKVSTDIEMLPGVERKYNSTIIHQNDGLVILETPYSNANSAMVIAEAEKQFPNQKIKAVVTTSQMWTHMGGIREYIARGIPVYTVDSNVGLITRFASQPHSFSPDALQLKLKKPVIKPVSGTTTIGSGENQMILYPFRSGEGERMLAVYFPQKQMLYASDMYNPKAFSQQMWTANVSWVKRLIEREKLNVKTVFGIHMPPADWSKVEADLTGNQ